MMQSSGDPEPIHPGPGQHRGWNSRGYLPHFDSPNLVQGVTFRLADSLPDHVTSALARDVGPTADEERRARIEAYLDAGYGACYLRDLSIGQVVEDTLRLFDGVRYCLLAWVVMPNHVHVLIETLEGFPLGGVVHSWKSYTAHRANGILGVSGAFWYPDYFDRFIRDERHYASAVAYIHQNPVKAGLVDRAEDWPFSSARMWIR